jgi:hypothetical protein
MKEYKTVSVATDQGWQGAKGTVKTTAVDAVLNKMAKDRWEMVCIEALEHRVGGSISLLCVFCREAQS